MTRSLKKLLSLFALVYRAQAAMTPSLTPLPSPKQSEQSITIGFINTFCVFSGLSYDSSVVTNYSILNLDHSNLNMSGSMTGVMSFFQDLAMAIAVDMINNDSSILPGVRVNIKRFSDCGGYSPDKDIRITSSAGFAGSIMVSDIVEKHQDVLGVVGYGTSTTNRNPGEGLSIAQIPFCSSSVLSPRFSDKNNYPYFFRPMPSNDIGKHFLVLLKEWDVARVGVILQSDHDAGRILGLNIIDALGLNGVKVVSKISLPQSLNENMLNTASTTLKLNHVKYIIVSGVPDFVGKLLVGLGRRGLVGPGYVWISKNYPAASSEPINSPFTQDFLKYLKGFVLISEIDSDGSNPLYGLVNSEFDLPIKTYNLEPSPNIALDTGVYKAFDCVMMMLYGFDRVVKSGVPLDEFSNRKHQSQLNHSLFRNLEYYGLTAGPIELTDKGDLSSPQQAMYFTGNFFELKAFGQTDREAKIFKYRNGTRPPLFFGSTIPPPDGPIPTKIKEFVPGPSNTAGIILIFYVVSGLLVCIVCLSFLILKIKDKTVIRSSPTYLGITIAGAALYIGSIYLNIGSASIQVCQSRHILILIGTCCLLGGILVKMSLNYILVLRSEKIARGFSARRFIFYYSGLLIAGEIVIGVLWAKIAVHKPVASDYFQMNEFDPHSFSYILYCPYNSTVVLDGLILVYNGAILCAAIVMAIMTSGSEVITKESSFASAIVGLFASVGVVAVLLTLTATSSNTVSTVLIQATALWILAVFPLIIVMGPKAYSIYKEMEVRRQFLNISISSNRKNQTTRAASAGTLPSPASGGSLNSLQSLASPQAIVKAEFISPEILLKPLGIQLVSIKKKKDVYFQKWKIASMAHLKHKNREWLLFIDAEAAFAVRFERLDLIRVQTISETCLLLAIPDNHGEGCCRIKLEFKSNTEREKFHAVFLKTS
ncbi:periplasmic binding protein-like I [Obelidium mucronatum]|nr:periplasmic binding protein-like I [Obelidium mucronatum]